MGCCQSDLKGESTTGANAEPAPEPMKKVATNFANVDYDSGATNRRETMYAPHEETAQVNELPAVAEREKPSTPAIEDQNKSAVSPKTSKVPDPNSVPEGGEAQQPYKDVTATSPTSPTQVEQTATIPHTNTAAASEITSPPTDAHTTGDMGLFSKSKPSADQPVMNGTDVASTSSSDLKKEFSNSIEPAVPEGVANGQVKEKKSLYRKYQELKRGSGTTNLSDEELLKYTGKTRAEFDEYSKNTSGVGGNQAAGSILAGGTTGFGLAGGVGEGLGGWGRSESTRRPDVT